MEQYSNINVLLDNLNELTDQHGNQEVFRSSVRNLNRETGEIQDDDQEAYGYYQYRISQICLRYYQGNPEYQRNVVQYQKNIDNFYNDYKLFQTRLNQQQNISDSQETLPYQQSINSLNSSRTTLLQEGEEEEYQDEQSTDTSVVSSAQLNSQVRNQYEIDLRQQYQELPQLELQNEEQSVADIIVEKEVEDRVNLLIDAHDSSGNSYSLGDIANGAGKIIQNGVQFATSSVAVVGRTKGIALSAVGTTRSISVTDLALGGVGWINLVVSGGIAAFEASYILFKYFKATRKEKKISTVEKDRLKAILKQELTALGMKSASSFGITTACMIAGGALGSIVPFVGTFLGTIIGSIVGTFLSICVDKYFWQKVIFNEKNLIKECERDIGLDTFYTQNNKGYTYEQFSKKVKLALASSHPDKFPFDEEMKANARQQTIKLLFAKEMIKRHRGWN